MTLIKNRLNLFEQYFLNQFLFLDRKITSLFINKIGGQTASSISRVFKNYLEIYDPSFSIVYPYWIVIISIFWYTHITVVFSWIFIRTKNISRCTNDLILNKISFRNIYIYMKKYFHSIAYKNAESWFV